jgi:hypothetical protein
VSYQVQFEGNALVQLRGLPDDAFEALLARVVELVDAPWDAAVAAPGNDSSVRDTAFGTGLGLLTFQVDDNAELIRISDITWIS